MPHSSVLVLVACVLANLAAVGCLVLGWRSPSPKRYAWRALAASVLVIALGLMGTVLGLQEAFGAVAGADPSRKAAMLSQGISDAMRSTAYGIAASVIPVVVCIALLVRRPPVTGARPA